jgi:transposase
MSEVTTIGVDIVKSVFQVHGVDADGIHCTRYADEKPFAQFATRANGEAGWQAYDLDASHSPNVTAPTALMEVLKQILPA